MHILCQTNTNQTLVCRLINYHYGWYWVKTQGHLYHTLSKLGSVHFSITFSKSKQCSDLGGWVFLGKVTVQISCIKKRYAFNLKKNEEKMFCSNWALLVVLIGHNRLIILMTTPAIYILY